MCGAVFDRPLVLDRLDPRPDCFCERFREVMRPYCNGPYFNEFEEDEQMKISVLIKDPGKKPRHVYIENSLKNLQTTVGGYIETVTLSEDAVIICNEEGRLRGLPYCCTICGVDFVGTVVIAGVKDEEFSDLPGDFKSWKLTFSSLFKEDADDGE